jgi:hypothetical protein
MDGVDTTNPASAVLHTPKPKRMLATIRGPNETDEVLDRQGACVEPAGWSYRGAAGSAGRPGYLGG